MKEREFTFSETFSLPSPSSDLKVPDDSGGGGGGEALRLGEGNSKMEQRGPNSKQYRLRFSCASALGILFAHSFEEPSIKKIASPYVCVRLERSSSETNDPAPGNLKRKNAL